MPAVITINAAVDSFRNDSPLFSPHENLPLAVPPHEHRKHGLPQNVPYALIGTYILRQIYIFNVYILVHATIMVSYDLLSRGHSTFYRVPQKNTANLKSAVIS